MRARMVCWSTSPSTWILNGTLNDVMSECAMFDTETGGFTEEYDPNAEPGEIPTDLLDGEEDAEAEA